MSSAFVDTLCWYVVHTHRQQEDRTSINLKGCGIETLTPRLWTKKYNEFSGKVSRIAKPLFPNYIFARFRFNESFHKVRFARGVHSLVGIRNAPTPVEDEIISLVRSRIGDDGFVKTDELKAGDEVMITEGRFKSFCGIFEQEMTDADRVRILLNTVSFQPHVVVDRALVTKVPQQRRSPVAA